MLGKESRAGIQAESEVMAGQEPFLKNKNGQNEVRV